MKSISVFSWNCLLRYTEFKSLLVYCIKVTNLKTCVLYVLYTSQSIHFTGPHISSVPALVIAAVVWCEQTLISLLPWASASGQRHKRPHWDHQNPSWASRYPIKYHKHINRHTHNCMLAHTYRTLSHIHFCSNILLDLDSGFGLFYLL